MTVHNMSTDTISEKLAYAGQAGQMYVLAWVDLINLHNQLH